MRGKYVMEVLLGVAPPAPPANVPPLVENVENEKPLPVRERLAQHRASAACAACHKMMDPDRPGARELQRRRRVAAHRQRRAVDPSGQLFDGTPLDGPVSLRNAILAHTRLVRHDLHREPAELRARPVARPARHADGAGHRPRRRARHDYRFSSLPAGHRDERAVPDAAGGRGRRPRWCDRAGTAGQRRAEARGSSSGRTGVRRARTDVSHHEKHLSRRTVLRGMGAAMALPLLEAMVPAQTLLAPDRGGAADRGWSASRWCTGRPAARSTASTSTTGCRRRPGATSSSRRSSKPLEPFRDYLTVVTQDRSAGRRGVVGQRGRRRSFPLERGVPHRRAPEADRRLGRRGRHVDRPDLRPAVRPGHAAAVDAARHRERRPGRRLRLQLHLRLLRADQLVVADDAAADDHRPAHGLREPVRRRRHRRQDRAARQHANRSILDGITRDVGRLAARPRAARPGAAGDLSRERPRDRAADPEDRAAQRQRRRARAAGGAVRRARLVGRARQADVRPAGAGLLRRR